MTLSALLQVPPPQMSFTSSVRSQILIKWLPLMCNKQIRMKNLPVLFFHSELLDWVSSVWCGVSNSACFLLSSFHLFWAFYFLLISCSRSPSRVLIFLYSSSPTLLLQSHAGHVFIHPSHTFLSLYMFPSSLLAHYLFCSFFVSFFFKIKSLFLFFPLFVLYLFLSFFPLFFAFYYLFVFCISFIFHILNFCIFFQNVRILFIFYLFYYI